MKVKRCLLFMLLVFSTSYTVSCQVEKWIHLEKELSDDEFANIINPSVYGLDTKIDQMDLTLWGKDSSITAKDVYHRILNWNSFQSPKKTGVLLKYEVTMDSTELDSNFTPSFYVYVPTGYNPKIPSKLLIYYKGGWISRDEFPINVDKEIVNDNPTFGYMDQHNSILVFPALKSKLAIYGWYGYEHLRKMVRKTKSIFNIDDNRIYLAGFSDGGRTVYNIAYLAPNAFAAFFSINGTFNSTRVNYPNFSNRNITSYLAIKDKIAYHKTAQTIAQEAAKHGAKWNIRMHDEGHFYHPYAEKVLPNLFESIKNITRDPFPHSITFDRAYDYKEFGGVDWLDIKTDIEQEPMPWHEEYSVIIPTSDTTSDTIQYGKQTAQIRARYFDNTFNIKCSQVKEVIIKLTPLMIDMNKPVRVIVNNQELYNHLPTFDKKYIIDDFINRRDRKQIWVNQLNLKVK